MPVLAGDRLAARVDLKCDRKKRELKVLSRRFEEEPPRPAARSAVSGAVERFAMALGLTVD